MDKKQEFPVSYRGRALDYTEARARCSILASQIKNDLSNPNREKGIVKRTILECAKSIVATLGFPQRIMCRFLTHAMPDVKQRTINDALPSIMKDAKKAANARNQYLSGLQGDFDIPFTRRQDDDSAMCEVVLNRYQLPELKTIIEKWERSKSETLGLQISEEGELFKASIPSQSEVEGRLEFS